MIYWLAQIVILHLVILINSVLPEGESQAVKIACKLITWGKIQILWNFFYYAVGWISLLALARSILSILSPLANAIRKVLTWWQMMIVGASMVAGILLLLGTAGSVIAAKIACATATIITIGLGIYGDWQDSDDTVG